MKMELINKITQELYNITIHLLDYDMDGLLFNIELESNGLKKCLNTIMVDNNVKDLSKEEFLCIKNKLINKFTLMSSRKIDEWDEKYHDDRLEYKKLAKWFEDNFKQRLQVYIREFNL